MSKGKLRIQKPFDLRGNTILKTKTSKNKTHKARRSSHSAVTETKALHWEHESAMNDSTNRTY